MEENQFIQLLKNLPASCVGDASESVRPSLPVAVARIALLNAQTEGLVTWWRSEGRQSFELTNKGREYLKLHGVCVD